MTTKTTVKQLERRFHKITGRRGDYIQVVRHISFRDNRLLDKDGYLLDEGEAKRMQKEDEEISTRGGTVVYLTRYAQPLVRSG